jgi:hypothetical protein
VTSGPEGTSPPTAAAGATFELEHFTWGGPDRLEVVGRFTGLDESEAGEPTLTVRGPDGVQRLEAVPGSVSGSPGGGRWRAEFAWREAPAAFEVAELELGEHLVVVLPDPTGRPRRFGRQVLEVRRTGPAEANGDVSPGTSTDRVRLQADLLVAREEARELRGELDRARDELATHRAALDAARRRHADDAERFRRELAEVSVAAEEAVAADRAAAQRLRDQLAERDQALEGARAETEALRGRVAELEVVAGEAEALRGRVAELEVVAGEAVALRARVAELERHADEARALRTEHERVRAAAAEARAGLEDLLRRLPSPDAGGEQGSGAA